MVECLICGEKCNNKRALASHLSKKHNITSYDYTIRYILNKNEAPLCEIQGCLEVPRYVSFTFKRFCKNHSLAAMKDGGSKGGKAEAWNKGKTKFTDKRILKQSTAMLGNQNHFFGCQHSKQTINKLKDVAKISEEDLNKRLAARANDFSFPDFSYSEYKSRQFQKIKCICNKCGKEIKKTLQSLERGTLCKFCYPFTVSKGEMEMANFIISNTNKKVLQNDRTIILPLELDIFIPELNLAFEYHGLYWHMDKGEKGFNKSLHFEKMQKCYEKNITLIQFFSSQWEKQRTIVESMIRNRLGVVDLKIGARETYLGEADRKEIEVFFNENHLHGNVKFENSFVLRSKVSDEILSVATIRRPFHRKYKNAIEIARFATKKNMIVVGGFSKLLKAIKIFAKNNSYPEIISYADLLHGNGEVYKKAGFDLVKHTGLNYWYTDGQTIYNRFLYRASNNLSEKQIAKQNNVYRIYGAGNFLYKMELKND